MLKAALLGAGFIAGNHAAAYDKLPNTKLAAVVDVREEQGRKMADQYGCSYYPQAEKMLECEDVDIVDICLPTFLHEKYVLLAAEHGKHVLLEKPFTLTQQSADNMVEACKKANVKFMAAQVLRFWPEYMMVKERYDRGDLGDMKLVYANRLAQHPNWGEWFKDPEKSGGGLFDLHFHDIDYLRYLFGPVNDVYAMGWQNENGCWNHVLSCLNFKSGVKAFAEGCFQMTDNYPFTMTLRVNGTKGTLDFNFSAGFNLEDVGGARTSLVYYADGKQPEPLEVKPGDGYFNEIKYFTECVENGKEITIIAPEESRDVVRIILALKKSLETGKKVKL